MCDKCIELDRKIARYREMIARVNDEIAAKGIGELIAEMIAKKAELHPQDKE